MCLVVSGGHTHLVKVSDYGKYEILGRTRDDAAGEAFDKVAVQLDWGIRGDRKLKRRHGMVIQCQFHSRKQESTIIRMTLVSVE